MAKITGMSGMIRGKSGPNVFRVSRGIQIMQQYNPNPNNPRSPKQTDRRLIFGDAVRQAKAFYDNPVTGLIWKKSQYKPRNLAVSEAMRNPVLSPVPGTELTQLAAGNLNQNWTSGFDMFGYIQAEYDSEEWSFVLDLENVGTNQPIIGLVVILYARPGFGNSEDDNKMMKLPDKPLVQAQTEFFQSPVLPGGSGSLSIEASELGLDYGSSDTPPKFEMPSNFLYNQLATIAVNRCWFAIPLTLENTGKGLRMEINGRMVTLGSMQYIWAT